MDWNISDRYDLTDREQLVLLHLIEQHVLTASPVGSRTISKFADLGLSSASIRNIMADLEEHGFISHPHTSAGRIPTDLGWRYYVDSLPDSASLSQNEREAIEAHFEKALPTAISEMIHEASHILSRISRQLAIVCAPSMSQGILERLELVRVASNRVMVILTVHSGLVKSIILQLRTEIRSDHLEHISRYLNDRLAGLTLREIRESMQERIRDADPEDSDLIRLFVESSDRLFDEKPDSGTLSIEGIHSVTQQPEFGDTESIRNIIALAENHNVIVHVLDSMHGEQALTIRIGKEIANDTLTSYSIIRAPYRVGQLSGSVSLVGPKRMDYPKMIAIVEFLSKIMST